MAYLPRFLVAVGAVPLAFLAIAFAAARLERPPETPAALVGAVTFALVVLAPSTKNALARAGVVLALAGLAAAGALLATR